MTNWDTLVKRGFLMYSPTYATNANTCERKAVLETMRSKRSQHFAYGHAFGTGAVELFKNMDKSKAYRLGKALLVALPHIKELQEFDEVLANKTPALLAEGLEACSYYAENYMTPTMSVWGMERKVIIKIVDHGKFPYYLGGTFDIAIKDSVDEINIKDFKAISSGFIYSFTTDMQIPFYNVVNVVASNKLGLNLDFGIDNHYLVHMTSDRSNLYTTFPVNLGVYTNHIHKHMKQAMLKARKLMGAALTFNGDLEAIVDVFDYNYSQCNRNEWACEFKSNCYGDGYNASEKIWDNRSPNEVIEVEATVEDIMQACDELKAKAVATFNRRKEGQNMNLGDVMDGGDLIIDDSGLIDALDGIL